MKTITLSSLGHTWILDLDGTVVKHNGYKIDGFDTFLDGAEAFLKNIPREDMIIITTSRSEEYRETTENFLAEHGIRFDHIIYDAPFGERILVNDCKPSGLDMAVAINVKRDNGFDIEIKTDEKL